MMKVNSLLSIGLATALIGSNLLWLYRTADQASVVDGCWSSYSRACGALRESLAMMPVIAAKRSREEVVAAARAVSDDDPFEKEGAIVVGDLAFHFTKDGRLRSVSATTSPLCEPPLPDGPQ
jgi:hypothetical protein